MGGIPLRVKLRSKKEDKLNTYGVTPTDVYCMDTARRVYVCECIKTQAGCRCHQ